jgi:hypothetical protein
VLLYLHKSLSSPQEVTGKAKAVWRSFATLSFKAWQSLTNVESFARTFETSPVEAQGAQLEVFMTACMNLKEGMSVRVMRMLP